MSVTLDEVRDAVRAADARTCMIKSGRMLDWYQQNEHLYPISEQQWQVALDGVEAGHYCPKTCTCPE